MSPVEGTHPTPASTVGRTGLKEQREHPGTDYLESLASYFSLGLLLGGEESAFVTKRPSRWERCQGVVPRSLPRPSWLREGRPSGYWTPDLSWALLQARLPPGAKWDRPALGSPPPLPILIHQEAGPPPSAFVITTIHMCPALHSSPNSLHPRFQRPW